jgi:DNA-binding response OmpR family regulator
MYHSSNPSVQPITKKEENMSSRNILIIDDDHDLTNSVQAYLEARGYIVRTADNGERGWAAMEESRPDLVVLDIMMDTDTEGFNLAYKIKRTEAFKEIPIIILSGFQQHLRDKIQSFEFIIGQEWPAAVLLEKPASLARILESVEQLLA